MRAAVARSGQLSIQDVADPVPGPGEVLAKVCACGICGSDLHALRYADQLIETSRETGVEISFDPSLDYIMGHEFSAEIVAVGPGDVGSVKEGDLVCSLPVALTATGVEPVGAYSNTYNGGYADLIRLTGGMCMKVPNGLDYRRAALTEPMSVGRHAVARAAVTPAESALVLGAGPVGLAVVAELRRLGVETIIVSDFSPRRRAVALAMGATAAADPASDVPIEVWQREDGRRSLVVFDAIGVPGTLTEAMNAAPAFSRVCVVGSCMEADTIRPLMPQAKQLTIIFSFAYDPFEFGDTLRAIAEGEVDVSPMITGTCGIDGVPAAFEVLGRPEEHVKILVEPGGPAAPTPI
jgi:threonine dehydrogenase-like Zn-dependent dehydrogenase